MHHRVKVVAAFALRISRRAKCTTAITGGLQRLETHARNISVITFALGYSRSRPFGLSTNQPTPSLCELEARPRRRGNQRLFSKLGPVQGLCIPTNCSDRALPQTGHLSTSSQSCDSYPSLGNAILVPLCSWNCV